MKVSFITVHVGENFGSTLQAIATHSILKKLGHESTLVNYFPPRVTFSGFWKNCLKSPKELVKGILKYPCFLNNSKKFDKYLKKFCKVSAPIYPNDNFAEKCQIADVYMTGSDQVWNFFYNEGLDTHYFFDGINQGKKVSYASSIGASNLSSEESNQLSKYTSEYAHISVREESAKALFKKIGREDVEVLIDPTLMLNTTEWTSYMSERIVAEEYLFVYLPYNISDIQANYTLIRAIAKMHNLKVISFSLTFMSDKYADKTIFFPSPGDFLSLMYHAKFVVTNSFHGTAFSLNLHKQFVVIPPKNFGTRVENILAKTNLSHLLLRNSSYEEYLQQYKRIEYSHVEEILNAERAKTFTYLKKAVDE